MTRVAIVNDSKNTIINFMVEGQKAIFKIDTNNEPKAVFLKEGDKVSFRANMLDNAKIATIEEIKINGLN